MRLTIGLLAILLAISVNTTVAQTYLEYSKKAYEASSNGKHEDAISYYAKAIELMPTDDGLYGSRSFEYEALGRLDLALADMNKAIDLHSDLLYSRIDRRGELYVHMGKYDLAVADFANVLAMKPRSKYVYEQRSKAYLMMGKPDMAFADIERFLQGIDLANEEPEDFPADGIFVGYLSLLKAGKKNEAKQFIDKLAPFFFPDSFEARIATFLQGSVTASQLLTGNTEDQARAHFYIGEMLLLGGDATAAAVHFEFMRDKGTKYSYEYDLAVVELSRMIASKPAK